MPQKAPTSINLSKKGEKTRQAIMQKKTFSFTNETIIVWNHYLENDNKSDNYERKSPVYLHKWWYICNPLYLWDHSLAFLLFNKNSEEAPEPERFSNHH